MSKDKKSKKKKTEYYDDGRTLADMSSLGGHSGGPRPRSSLKDQMRTYFSTVRAMFLPMLTFMGGITVVFLVIYLILELMS